MSRRTREKDIAKRRRWKLWIPALIAVPLAFAAAPWLIGPPCPREFTIVAGPRDGAYHQFARQYAEILERDGITLTVRETAGSVENRERLCDDDEKPLLGMLQGGTANDAVRNDCVSLGSLYHEPVWVFHRKSIALSRLSQLESKRVAIGPDGSGTRAVAELLLRDNGIDPNSDKVSALTGRKAKKALVEGRIDAAIFVISPSAKLIRELLATPDIALFSFSRAQAYCRRHRFLSSVTLAEGAIDLKRNLPERETVLLAPTATLVARKDIHPALVPLLMRAVRETHEQGGLLNGPGEFPSDRHTDVAMHLGAKRYLKSGPTFLYRTLPFQWAVRIDRLKLMLLPLITLLFPLFKLTPPLWRWRIRSRMYRIYARLREIDEAAKAGPTPEDCAALLEQLRNLDNRIGELSVPTAYMSEYYDLQLHAAHLTDRIAQMQHRAAMPKRAAA